MRKACLMLPIVCLLCLSACRMKTPDDLWTLLQEKYEAAEYSDLTGELTVRLGEICYPFTLRYTEKDGAAVQVVEKPDNIAGLSAAVSEDDGILLTYDGAELYAGSLGTYRCSPLALMPTVLNCCRTHNAVSLCYTCVEGVDCLETDFEPEPGLFLRCWFDRETLLPVSAELFSDDVLAVSCVFRDCSVFPAEEEVFLPDPH